MLPLTSPGLQVAGCTNADPGRRKQDTSTPSAKPVRGCLVESDRRRHPSSQEQHQETTPLSSRGIQPAETTGSTQDKPEAPGGQSTTKPRGGRWSPFSRFLPQGKTAHKTEEKNKAQQREEPEAIPLQTRPEAGATTSHCVTEPVPAGAPTRRLATLFSFFGHKNDDATKSTHPLLLHCKYGNQDQVTEQLEQTQALADQLLKWQEGEHTERLTPLMAASRHGQANIVKHLLTSGADVNTASDTGMTALFEAAESNHCDESILNFLLENGANVNHQNTLGETALMGIYRKIDQAAARRCATRLLVEGVDVNQQDNHGFSPLSLAIIRSAESDSVKQLIEAKALVNQTDGLGNTSLMYACYRRNHKAVQLLLNVGADSDYRSGFRLTAIAKSDRKELVMSRPFRCCPLFNDTPLSVARRREPAQLPQWLERSLYNPEQIARRQQQRQDARACIEYLESLDGPARVSETD